MITRNGREYIIKKLCNGLNNNQILSNYNFNPDYEIFDKFNLKYFSIGNGGVVLYNDEMVVVQPSSNDIDLNNTIYFDDINQNNSNYLFNNKLKEISNYNIDIDDDGIIIVDIVCDINETEPNNVNDDLSISEIGIYCVNEFNTSSFMFAKTTFIQKIKYINTPLSISWKIKF